MSVKRPEISLNRSGTDITVTLDNFVSGDAWNIYMSDDFISAPSQEVAAHDQASYTIQNTDLEKVYILRVSLNNYPVENSLTIIAETETGIEFEPIAPTTVTVVTKTKSVSWGDDLDLDFLVIDGLRLENEPGGPLISIPKNKTL